MKITIITVCLNSADTIEKTIKSVISQDYTEKEYILVDGGSTDGTIEIIKKYSTSIAKWVSEPDQGIFDAMNKGIGMAVGDVIGFLNSDDWYLDSALKSVCTVFQEKDCDCVCCDNLVIRKDGKEECYDASEVPLEDMYKRMIYYHSAIFAKKEMFDREDNFDLQYKIAADYDWMLRIMKKGARVCYLHRPVFTFCYGGISSVNEIACAKEAWEIAIRHLPEDKTDYRKAIDQRLFEIIMQASDAMWIRNSLASVFNFQNPLVLWGAGYRGRQCLLWLQKGGIAVWKMIDTNENKWGETVQGVLISPPGFLAGKTGTIIITPEDNIVEIQNTIRNLQGSFDVYELGDLLLRITDS